MLELGNVLGICEWWAVNNHLATVQVLVYGGASAPPDPVPLKRRFRAIVPTSLSPSHMFPSIDSMAGGSPSQYRFMTAQENNQEHSAYVREHSRTWQRATTLRFLA